MSNKFIQFELWKDCKQGCKFCCNKGAESIDKNKSCLYILDVLRKIQPGEYDKIGLIGGELFNGEMKHCMNAFFSIMQRIKELNPQTIYIATSLIYDVGDYLIPVLNALDKVYGILDKIVLCTSWDIKYRFKTPEENQLWFKNMFYLNKKYPNLKIHTEIILTQYFIDLINNDKWDIDLFKKVLNTSVDFIEPASGLYYEDKFDCQKNVPGFFPTKSSFYKFLQKMKDKIDLNDFLSVELRSDELHYFDGAKHRVAKNRRKNECKVEISDKTKKYDIGFIDSDETMRSIVEAFQATYGFDS